MNVPSDHGNEMKSIGIPRWGRSKNVFAVSNLYPSFCIPEHFDRALAKQHSRQSLSFFLERQVKHQTMTCGKLKHQFIATN
jgi:hypothetical protein